MAEKSREDVLRLLEDKVNNAPEYDVGIGTEVGGLIQSHPAVAAILGLALERAHDRVLECANTNLGSQMGAYEAAQHQGAALALKSFVSEVLSKSVLPEDYVPPAPREMEDATPARRRRSRAKTAPIRKGSKRRRPRS